MEQNILKSLVVAYFISGIMLLGLSFFVYKMDISEQMVDLGIRITYLLSSLAGGWFLGKRVKRKRFLWGVGVGMMYLFLLLCISFGIYRTSFHFSNFLWALGLCVGGGMIGGMIS